MLLYRMLYKYREISFVFLLFCKINVRSLLFVEEDTYSLDTKLKTFVTEN
jgi:hypothetical protein